MLWLKDLARRLLALTPYRLERGAPNRFQAIDFTLQHLHELGYVPRQIIDGGAHLGWFALLARQVFPAAAIHMIDPQPACRAPLEDLAVKRGFGFNPYALSDQPGSVPMVSGDQPNTGAHLGPAGPSEQVVAVEATTLDVLFADKCQAADRTLLKLDLEGHEMPALHGAARLLPMVEVILIEVSFFRQDAKPTAPQFIDYLVKAGFELFDLATLGGRAQDNRLRIADLVFVRRGSPLLADNAWALGAESAPTVARP